MKELIKSNLYSLGTCINREDAVQLFVSIAEYVRIEEDNLDPDMHYVLTVIDKWERNPETYNITEAYYCLTKMFLYTFYNKDFMNRPE